MIEEDNIALHLNTEVSPFNCCQTPVPVPVPVLVPVNIFVDVLGMSRTVGNPLKWILSGPGGGIHFPRCRPGIRVRRYQVEPCISSFFYLLLVGSMETREQVYRGGFAPLVFKHEIILSIWFQI